MREREEATLRRKGYWMKNWGGMKIGSAAQGGKSNVHLPKETAADGLMGIGPKIGSISYTTI
jgi:hypothetical protein